MRPTKFSEAVWDGVSNAPGPAKWGAAGAVIGATAVGVVGPLGAVAGAVAGAQAAATMAAVLDPPPTSRLHGSADYETVEAPVAGPGPEQELEPRLESEPHPQPDPGAEPSPQERAAVGAAAPLAVEGEAAPRGLS